MTEMGFGVIFGFIVRGIALMAAGWLAAHGLLPGGTEGEWAAAVAAATVAYVWSWWQKRQAIQKTNALIQAAIQMPSTATVADVHAAVADSQAQP
jgi:hypothetical protein